MQRIIIDINSIENTNILVRLLNKIDFIKNIRIKKIEKEEILYDKKILFNMYSKIISKF